MAVMVPTGTIATTCIAPATIKPFGSPGKAEILVFWEDTFFAVLAQAFNFLELLLYYKE
jgi:hypothetical protein